MTAADAARAVRACVTAVVVVLAAGALPARVAAQFTALGPPAPSWKSSVSPAVAARSDSLRARADSFVAAANVAAAIPVAEERAQLLGDTAVAFAMEYAAAQYDLASVYDAAARRDEALAHVFNAARSYRRVPPAVTWRQFVLVAIQLSKLCRTHAQKEEAVAIAAPLLDAARAFIDPAEWTYTETALALLYVRAGRPTPAAALMRSAADRAARRFGVQSAQHVSALHDAVMGFSDNAMSEGDGVLVRRYVALAGALRPRVDTTYGEALHWAAAAFSKADQPIVAESLYRAALASYTRGGGADSRSYFETLADFGELLNATRDQRRALPVLQKALAGLRRHPTAPDAELVTTLGWLATAQQYAGDYAAAGAALAEAVEIARAESTDHAKNVVVMLTKLAQFQSDVVRDHVRARELAVEAGRVLRAMTGPDPARYSEDDTSLYSDLQLLKAQLDLADGQPAAAVLAADSAVRALQTVRGRSARQTLGALDDLAGTYRAIGRFDAADSVLTELAHDAGDAPVATRQIVGVWVRTRRADLAVARGAQRDVIALNRAEHAATARNFPGAQGLSTYMERIARAEAAIGDPDGAERDILVALREDQADFVRVAAFTSSREMLSHASSLIATLETAIDLALARPPGSVARATDADSALTWLLRRRGLVLATAVEYRRSERAQARDPKIAALAASIRDTQARLARLAMTGGGDTAAVARATLLRGSEQQEAQLGRVLSAGKRGAAFGATAALVTIDAVRARLGPNAALVEFLRKERYDFGAEGRAGQWFVNPAHYVAFVVRAGRATMLIDLGNATDIEAAVRELRDAQHTDAEPAAYTEASRVLHDLVIAPLAAALNGLPRSADGPPALYLVPDGELSRVPFEGLLDSANSALIDRYAIAYLSSGRDLLSPHEPSAVGTVVFAGPDFNLGAAARARAAAAIPTAVVRAAASSPDQATAALRDLRGLAWVPLGGATAEAGDITHRLRGTAYAPLTTYVGADALEERLYAIRAPRVLHLATHGFFVATVAMNADDRAHCNEAAPPRAEIDAAAGAARGMDRLRCADDPLLRSGIVLSGANTIGDGAAGVADGWVLAAEIAQMDLHGTDLVVLSACETGLGDLRVGEGVYGLRRAFELAGARNVLMSLYKVPDAETRELLADFYGGLAKGLRPRAAFRGAQLAQRTRHAHPLYWAAFVLVGRD